MTGPPTHRSEGARVPVGRGHLAPRRADGTTVTLPVTGDIDQANATDVATMIDAAVATGHVHLVVDLSRATFMGAALVNALVAGRRSCRRRGGSLHVTGADAGARRLLRITHLQSLLERG